MPNCTDCGKYFDDSKKKGGTPGLCWDCDDPDKDYKFDGQGNFTYRMRDETGAVLGSISGPIPDERNTEFLLSVVNQTLDGLVYGVQRVAQAEEKRRDVEIDLAKGDLESLAASLDISYAELLEHLKLSSEDERKI